MKIISTPFIEFKTEKKYWDVIPKPYPAGRLIPNWLRGLPQYIKASPSEPFARTIKRCSPFIDALNLGWIIPLAGDVEVVVKDGRIDFRSSFPEKLMDLHDNKQINGCKGPTNGMDAIKFLNYWSIRVAKGYSVLFVPPLNRSNDLFEPFSGVVECDKYWNYVNFPAMLKKDNFSTIIEQGTPIIQLIPIPRTAIPKKGTWDQMNTKEQLAFNKVQKKLQAHTSHYRDDVWSKGKCPFVKI